MTKKEQAVLDYYENPNHCKFCGEIIEVINPDRLHDTKRKQFCNKSCAASFRNAKDGILVVNKTLGYYTKDKKYLSGKCQHVRKDARRVLEGSNVEKVCFYCKNHEFDEILEVHHIKGVLEFDLDDYISDINDVSNLMWLCPNHHTMLEKELIQL